MRSREILFRTYSVIYAVEMHNAFSFSWTLGLWRDLEEIRIIKPYKNKQMSDRLPYELWDT